jgi:hypothetical protein
MKMLLVILPANCMVVTAPPAVGFILNEAAPLLLVVVLIDTAPVMGYTST